MVASEKAMPKDWIERTHMAQDSAILAETIRLFAPSDDVCVRLQRETIERLEHGENSTMGFRELAQEFLPPVIFDLMRLPVPEKSNKESDEMLFCDSIRPIQHQIIFAWTDALAISLKESLVKGESKLFLGHNVYPIYVPLSGGYYEFFDLAESDLSTMPLDSAAIGQLVDIVSENVKKYFFADLAPALKLSPDLGLRALEDRNFEVFRV